MPVVDEWVTGPALPGVPAVSGWWQSGVAPAVHRGLPSPWLTVIVTLAHPLVVAAHPDPAQPGDRYEALVGGLHTRPAVITHDGGQSGVQLAVHPLAARRLLGVPAGELADRDEHAADVAGPTVARWREQLLEAPDWAARFAVLGRELAASPVDLPAELRRAWVLLCRGTPVGEVAREVGWSPRRLHARCRAETGLCPQDVVRVARFDRARRAVAARTPLARVAAEQGYADQPHLTREFTRFAGLSPTAWLAAERRWVQDDTATGAAGSRA